MSPRQKSVQKFGIRLDAAAGTRMTCSEANCQNAEHGWAIVLDPENTEHARAAAWIKGDSGRRFIETRSELALEYLVGHGARLGITVTPALSGLLQRTPPGMVVFLFYPGQQCFKVHVDREVVFAHQRGLSMAGVFRATSAARIHERPEDYMEHFNEEADKVNRMVQLG